MDFLWFWVSMGIMVEVTRRSVMHCYPKTPNKASTDVGSLKEPLLAQEDLLGKSKCPYGCCSKDIFAYETDAEESPRSTESTDEIVSWDESEEYEESLVDNRTKGKHLIQEDDGMQQIVGHLYPSANSGHPKLVRFKVSDNYFQVSSTAGARLAKEASAKIHPQPSGTVDQAHSSMRNSSSQLSKEKEGVLSKEIAGEYRTLPPIQEVMSSHDESISTSDEIRSSEGQCSYKGY